MYHFREVYLIFVDYKVVIHYFRILLRICIWNGFIRFIFCIGLVVVLSGLLLVIGVYFVFNIQPVLPELPHTSPKSSKSQANDYHEISPSYHQTNNPQHYSSYIP